MRYYTYILSSLKDRRFYIGFTRSLEKRLNKHNSGKVKSTRNRRPFMLVYFEMHLSKLDSLRREKYFKTTKGKKTIRLMLRDYLNRKKSNL